VWSNTLYGAAANGGSGNGGALFKLNTDGTGYTNFFSFGGSTGTGPHNLILSSGLLYGITGEGGSGGGGTVFRVNSDGSGYTNLHVFSTANSNACRPGAMVLSGSSFYGTTTSGGTAGQGALFKINTDGTGFTNLLNFAVRPGKLLLAGNALYGTTTFGNQGTVFTVNTDGTGFTTLYSFSALTSNGVDYTNADGAYPSALIASGNVLYGTTQQGGSAGNGTIFKLPTDGSSFTALYSFTATPPYVPGSNTVSAVTNDDGSSPDSLALCGNVLYGAASGGGAGGVGTLFQLNTDGTGFATLYNMSSLTWLTNVVGTTTYITYTNADGLHPSNLVLGGRTIYGTAGQGGAGNGGTVFAFNRPACPLKQQFDGTHLVLMWDDPGMSLQSAPAASGPWTSVNGATSPYTNGPGAPLLFFRLQGN
jgi:uncharacterized repeat protein (TIGR03803 family)